MAVMLAASMDDMLVVSMVVKKVQSMVTLTAAFLVDTMVATWASSLVDKTAA